MFQLSLEGKGAYTIANIFNDEGIPTKFKKNFTGRMARKDSYTNNIKYFEKSDVIWRGNVISDMLRNKIYKGIREWNRHEDKLDYIDGESVKTRVKAELIVAEVPIIVDPVLWEKVQINLEKNRKNVGRKDEYHYLLNGLVYCDKCGGEYRGRKRLKGNDNAYKCAAKRYPNSKCDNRGISIPRLESFIIKYVFVFKDFKKHFKDFRKDNDNNKIIDERLNNERTKLAAIEKKIKNAFDLLLDTEIEDNEQIKNRLSKLQSQKRELIETIEILERKVSENNTKNMEKKIANVVGSLELDSKQEIIDADFDEIKKAVHQIIDWVKISHNKLGKGGNYFIKVKFKGGVTYSVFQTNWKLSEFKLLEYVIPKDNELSDIISSSKIDVQSILNKKNIANQETTISNTITNKKHVHYQPVIKIEKDEVYLFD